MELNEAVRRVLGHWPLILSFVAVSIVVAAAINWHESTYTASARLALDAEDPQSRAEASGIADTARAIATSPTQVERAMQSAHITGRDPVEVARDRVDVESLGASGVMELSVSDSDPHVAAPMANALARRVISTRLDVTRGEVDRVAGDLDRRIAAINRKIVDTESGIAESGVGQTPRPESVRRRDLLVQARSALEAQRVSLLATGAQLRDPSIISAAEPPAEADESNLLPDVILAAFLGLIVGTGVASLIETFRPTLAGGEAIARALDVPLLGKLRAGSDGQPEATDVASLGMYLRLAAKAVGLRNVRLVPARSGVDLTDLAQRLDSAPADPAEDGTGSRVTLAPTPVAVGATESAAGSGPGSAAAPATAHDDGTAVGIRPFSLHGAVNNGRPTGLVLVAPDRLRQSELVAARHLLRLTPAPLLGVATYELRRTGRSDGAHGPREQA